MSLCIFRYNFISDIILDSQTDTSITLTLHSILIVCSVLKMADLYRMGKLLKNKNSFHTNLTNRNCPFLPKHTLKEPACVRSPLLYPPGTGFSSAPLTYKECIITSKVQHGVGKMEEMGVGGAGTTRIVLHHYDISTGK